MDKQKNIICVLSNFIVSNLISLIIIIHLTEWPLSKDNFLLGVAIGCSFGIFELVLLKALENLKKKLFILFVLATYIVYALSLYIYLYSIAVV